MKQVFVRIELEHTAILGSLLHQKKCLQLWRSLMRPFSPAGCEEKYQYFEIISDHSISIKCFRFR